MGICKRKTEVEDVSWWKSSRGCGEVGREEEIVDFWGKK
jgi:hypothetical protein